MVDVGVCLWLSWVQEIRSKYLSNETFTPETAKKASPAAEGMCKWVLIKESMHTIPATQRCGRLPDSLGVKLMLLTPLHVLVTVHKIAV
jgi:hypothetical protein